MDLFGNLPPPSAEKTKLNSSSSMVGLYDDLPTDEKNKFKRSNDGRDEKEEIKKPKTSDNHDTYDLKSFITERQGEREDMQDAAIMLDDCTSDYNSIDCGMHINKVAFFGVYDGHGGNRASRFAKENLHKNILKNLPKEFVQNFDRELKKSLIKAFKETDEAFLSQARVENPPLKDGSTASCVLLINNTIYVSNIGDSKAILVREKSDKMKNIVSLTQDHSPTLYQERQRIQNAGGFVRDGRVQGVLEVSRAFGDARYKKYVISTPEVFKSTLTNIDRYLLIACDGLWKTFTVTEAVQFVDNILNDSSILDVNDRYEKACKEIANEAVRKCSGDNVTIVIVRISKMDGDG